MDKKKLLLSIILLSLPAIGEMALNTLLGFSDTLMISRLIGTDALAGVGFANQIIFTLVFIFSSFNAGGVTIISRKFGEKKYKEMNKVSGEIISLNLILGITISLIAFLFIDKLFIIFDITSDVLNLTIEYFKIIIYGLPFMFLMFSFSTISRGRGDTKTPMIITGIVNILNIAGNYILITGLGPFPAMGVKGTALATTISRLIAVIFYIKFMFFNDNKLKLSDLRITKENFNPLWHFSYPGAIEQASMQLSFVATGVIISFLDTISEATFRILINIESISFMPAVGLSIASATLVGKALGEKDPDKAMATGYISGYLSIAWGIFIGSIFLIFPETFLKIFTTDSTIIEKGTFAILLAGFNQPLLNYIIVQNGTLKGAGDTRTVMLLTTFRLWILFVPATYILIELFHFNVEAIWYAEIFSFIITIPIVFNRFRNGKWLNINIYKTEKN